MGPSGDPCPQGRTSHTHTHTFFCLQKAFPTPMLEWAWSVPWLSGVLFLESQQRLVLSLGGFRTWQHIMHTPVTSNQKASFVLVKGAPAAAVTQINIYCVSLFILRTFVEHYTLPHNLPTSLYPVHIASHLTIHLWARGGNTPTRVLHAHSLQEAL